MDNKSIKNKMWECTESWKSLNRHIRDKVENTKQ